MGSEQSKRPKFDELGNPDEFHRLHYDLVKYGTLRQPKAPVNRFRNNMSNPKSSADLIAKLKKCKAEMHDQYKEGRPKNRARDGFTDVTTAEFWA